MLVRVLRAVVWHITLRAFTPFDDTAYGDTRYAGRGSTTLAHVRRDRWDSGPPPRPKLGKALALVGLALAALVVIAGTAAVEAQLASNARRAGGGSTGSGVPIGGTPSPATTTTPASGQIQNWVQVGPAYVQRSAVAESRPSRLYACGFQAQNVQTGPISMVVSSDGGATWQTVVTPAKGAYCDVRVSTTVPQDVALYASAVCDQESCTSPDPPQLDFSMDSGAHWTVASLPANNGTPVQPSYSFAWAGDTLMVETVTPGVSGGHYLVASTNGGPFTWVDQNITGLPSGMSPIAGELRAISTTIYATFSGTSTSGSGCANPQNGCLVYARTSDGGATWTTASPTYTGKAYSGVGGIRLVAGALGAPLIGAAEMCQCSAAPLLRSRDGGATWVELPAYPSGYQAREFWTVEAPDGTVYATLEQNLGGPIGIYVLSPGASAWKLVAYPTGGQFWSLAAVTWDGSGHPAALWGWSWSNSEVDGLWRHAP